MKKIFKISYFIVPLIAVLTMLIGGYATSFGVNGWYQTISLPAVTPDGNIIGAIWTVIYILTAISVLNYIIKVGRKDKNYNVVMGLFIINVVLNILWSFIFFVWHSFSGAVVEMIILEITNILLIIYLWRKSLYSALLLLPYAIWVAFATYIAILTWIVNS